MFLKDIAKLTTAISLTAPRPKPVAPAPVVGGIVAGTLVETETGWRPVETLTIGSRVHTLDGGLTRILALDRRILRPEAETSLIHVPGGLYDTCSDVMLVPGQHLLVDTLGDDSHGQAPFLLLPAVALTADPLVHRDFPDLTVEVITPLFAEEEVIFANSGMLLHCPSLLDGAGRYPEASFFPRLDAATARDFLARRAARLAA